MIRLFINLLVMGQKEKYKRLFIFKQLIFKTIYTILLLVIGMN